MTATTKQYALRAMRQATGDDLERATRAFHGLSADIMNSQYGSSGKTRQQILDEYRAEREAYNTAIQEIEAL